MPGTNLTRDEAAERAALVRVDTYDVALDLTSGPETFRTTTTVVFSATTPGATTFIDLIAPSVERIDLNGTALDPATHVADSRITLPDLQAENTLTVEATGAYMNTGEGLHRFVDPADGEVYLYTQFEVPDSRRMFAVFEQPDLKAGFAFTITAPAHWQVLSNQPTPQPVAAPDAVNVDGGDVARWEFTRTPRLSSYITALVAGPYHVVRDEVQTRKGTVPLGVFCRTSLAPYLDAEEILDCTKRGFAFFEEEFDSEYPFEKYDQIFTPEYNMGAMENAGCVTIVENYVFRAKVPEAVVERRALTILHELAHMWFGDLVTMTWWDDLWLNESFAEWASTTCQAEATRWETAWTTFATSEKAWAYRQDQLSSTHPVAADMRHLEDVEVNFDGITYAKGASVLKQLVAYVGREPFRDGLRAYFRKHAWGNTTLADLLAELEATSGRELGSWVQLWLQTSGVNTLRPVIEADADGTLTSVVIEQTTPVEHPTLRPHRLAVGCYDLVDGAFVRTHREELDIDGAHTAVPGLVGRKRPDLLLVNDEDLAYAKIRLDEVSLAAVVANPTALTDSLVRALVLGAAWDMTRDGELATPDYLELVLPTLATETDSTLLRTQLQQISAATLMYVPPASRAGVRALLADRLGAFARAAEPASDAQLQLVQGLAAFATSPEDLGWLRGLLDGEHELPGLAVDQEMRWTLLSSLAAGGAVDEEDITAEAARDRTATGRERAASALAARPTAEAKAQAWASVADSDGLANSMVGSVALGFGRVHDAAVLEPYVATYLERISGLWADRTHAIAAAIAQGFYPHAVASQELYDATQAWLDANPEAPAGLRRTVSENRDGVARALRAQAAVAVGSPVG